MEGDYKSAEDREYNPYQNPPAYPPPAEQPNYVPPYYPQQPPVYAQPGAPNQPGMGQEPMYSPPAYPPSSYPQQPYPQGQAVNPANQEPVNYVQPVIIVAPTPNRQPGANSTEMTCSNCHYRGFFSVNRELSSTALICCIFLICFFWPAACYVLCIDDCYVKTAVCPNCGYRMKWN